MMQSWLQIAPASHENIQIDEKLDYGANAAKNLIWMRGDPYELEQMYKQLGTEDGNFWGSNPGFQIRKIHTGLPGLIVNRLTDIVVRDMNSIEVGTRTSEWDAIAKENNFRKLCRNAVQQSLTIGDGAFKISYDADMSDKPILEFYPGTSCEFKNKRGRLKEIIFKTKKSDHKEHSAQKYLLLEHYGFGYVKYELKRISGDNLIPVPLDTLEETKDLSDVIFGGYEEDADGHQLTKGSYMMAVPFMITESTKYPGRGESIYERKCSSFDALDEVVSQWSDAVRSGRSKTYIPTSLIPKDDKGNLIKPSAFEDHYISVECNMSETAKNQIETKQPAIPSDNYLQSYITFLDLCLQGIISPSTLGIDVKKLDNADAQREKEKTTLYTRNSIIEALTLAIQKLVINTLATVDSLDKKENREVFDLKVDVLFGEYANPSFEAVVETVTKAKTGGIMSVRSALDEMYGDTKDDTWKDQEVVRISEDQGATQVPEPNIATDLNGPVS